MQARGDHAKTKWDHAVVTVKPQVVGANAFGEHLRCLVGRAASEVAAIDAGGWIARVGARNTDGAQ